MQILSRAAFLARQLSVLCAFGALAFIPAFGSELRQDIDQLFLPYTTDRVALSPDGKHVAYSVRHKESLRLMIFDVEKPESPVRIDVADDAVRPMSGDKFKTPVRMTFLRWAKPGRLVFGADIMLARNTNPRGAGFNWTVVEGAVFATGPDGKDARLLVGPDDVAYESDSLGGTDADGVPLPPPPPVARSLHVVATPPDDPDSIIVEALRGPGAPRGARYRVNINNAKVTQIEDLEWRGTLLFDAIGEPRIAHLPGETSEEFVHVPPVKKGGFARALDKYIAANPPLNFHITPQNYLGERSFPLSFGYDSNLLYFASNVGRSTYGIFALDLDKKAVAPFRARNDVVDLADLARPLRGDDLVFDRHRRELAGIRYVLLERATQWLDPELAHIQAEFNKKFAGETVEILEWDQARSRFLILISHGGDPGRYYVYMRKEARLVEFMQRAPWLDTKLTSTSTPFSLQTKNDVNLSGYFTKPRMHRVSPPPLVIWCHDGPWERDEPGFNPYVQIISDMGFAVLRVNYRGSAGFGRAHRDAIREAIDRVPVEDVLAAVRVLGRTKAFDPKRVAIMGQGFGGYIAVRALQLHPDKFRCAIGIDARLDLERWVNDINAMTLSDEETPAVAAEADEEGGEDAAGFGGRASASQDRAALRAAMLRHFLGNDREKLRAMSAVAHADTTEKPILFVQSSNADDISAGPAKRIAAAMRKREIPVEFLDINPDYARGVPGARARVFNQIEGFLNLHLYDYKVNLGDLKKIADEEESLAPKGIDSPLKIETPRATPQQPKAPKLELPPLKLNPAEETKAAPKR